MSKRGNGLGSVYKRKDRGTWTAQIVVGLTPSSDNKMIEIKKRIGGFKTKKEAITALNKLLNGEEIVKPKSSLENVYQAWREAYKSRVLPKTMRGYEQAYAHFGDLKYRKIHTITAADLQKKMDECEAGKRTHQMMKVTAGLIWAYALDLDIVKKDITENLYIGKHQTTTRDPLTEEDVALIKNAIGEIPYADYVYCLCFLGFRPGEFCEIKKDQVGFELIDDERVYFITEGIKTDAGKNRVVVIPKQIESIVLDRMKVEGTDYLFPFYFRNRYTGEVISIRKMKTNYFNESVFKPLLKKLGITGNKVPYSARHTYADKLKRAEGDDRDKAALIGHTDFNFTRKQYQSSPLRDLKAVTDSLK